MPSSRKTDHLKKIAERVVKGIASDEEKQLLDEYYDTFGKHPDVAELLSPEQMSTLKGEMKAAFLKRMQQTPQQITPLYKQNSFRAAVAAAILVVISAAVYSVKLKPVKEQQIIVDQPFDFSPGGNKAILTLSDGSNIILDQAANGVLAKQAGLTITKTKDGQLVYDISSSENSNRDGYNSIETPNGGQYQINLPDGSKVWLNATSSLKFPPVFKNNERRVELTGEAYFEVAEDKSRPFRVGTYHQAVEVLGTHFNINSYKDESAVKTTLLEGSVKILAGSQTKIIKPGQQAQVRSGSPVSIVQADTELVIAWKNGLFEFKDADIKTIMRQLSRWYNVEVDYQGEVPDRVFSGKIYRNVNISQVLEILSFTKIHFKIEKDRIIVLP